LLRFRVHQLVLGGRHYLLLPKLNRKQLDFLRRELGGVSALGGPSHNSSETAIHVDRAGLCWSNRDPADAVLPLIPEILSMPKENATREAILGMYFAADGTCGSIRTRLEASSNWRRLRGAGECGLTPDEHAVAGSVIRAGGSCTVVTDYASEGSSAEVWGRRRYFRSELPSSEILGSLRTVGERRDRNSYLPQDGLLKLRRQEGSEALSAVEELGDWCSFAAS
jgi:hypothetical protein